jgi:hypothetical protein
VIRICVAVIVGLAVWVLCATGLDILLRHVLEGYAAAEPQMQFTLTMKIARLALPGAIPSLVAGFVCAWIAPHKGGAVAALTIILLLVFLPSHYQLWNKFPVWYHATFLGSLILLTWAGAKLRAATAGGYVVKAAPAVG